MTILRIRQHSRSLGEGLWMMYQAGYLLDIEVHLHGKTTKAHRLVLAALSPVLRPSLLPAGRIGGGGGGDSSGQALDLSSAIDANSNQSVSTLRSINLDDVVDEPLDLDTLLEFIYKGEVTLSDESNATAGLPSLLRTAEVLKIDCLVEEDPQASGEVEQITISVEQPLMSSYHGSAGDHAASAADEHHHQHHHHHHRRPPQSPDQLQKPRRKYRRRAKDKSGQAVKAEQLNDAGGGDDADGDGDGDDDASPSFWCPHCCELFSDPIVYSDHMAKLHPSAATDEEQVSRTSITRSKRRINYRDISEGSIGKKRSKSKSGKRMKIEKNCESKSESDGLEQSRHSCMLCDFWTAHNWRLTKHLAAIHKVYDIGRPAATEQCQFCDYACVTAALLRRHIKCKHSTDRPYKCLECDFSAAIRSDLDRHMTAKHCKERRFQCAFCGYKSKTKNAHERHSKTHAKTILTCKTCGLWYTSDGYRRHVKSHVVVDDNGLNSTVVVKCHLCEQLMSIDDTIESSMRSHLMQVHSVDVDKKNAQIERCNRAKMIPPLSHLANAAGGDQSMENMGFNQEDLAGEELMHQ